MDFVTGNSAPLSSNSNSNNSNDKNNHNNIRSSASATTTGKTICPHGVVCCVRMELFPCPPGQKPYTGLLTPNTVIEHGILRMSSAMKPPGELPKGSWTRTVVRATSGNKLRNARLFPCAALKFFRHNANSGNLLFGGSKIGQREMDYFAHCQCTTMTEQMPRLVVSGGMVPFTSVFVCTPSNLPTQAMWQIICFQSYTNFPHVLLCVFYRLFFFLTKKPFVKRFWAHSRFPLSLGLSDFCQYNVNGEPATTAMTTQEKEKTEEEEKEETQPPILNFPFALVIKPCIDLTTHPNNGMVANEGGGAAAAAADANDDDTENAFDRFLETVLTLSPETVLFDVFACATPQDVTDPSKLQRIGRIVTTSSMLPSSPDDGLFFKHQLKEEDYALRPDWEDALKTKIAIDRTVGTVGQLVGWKLFEQHIAQNTYIDFEESGKEAIP
jgi:hypothetical protein